MEKGKMKEVNEEKKTQFRWSKTMSKEVLNFLAMKFKREIDQTSLSNPHLLQQQQMPYRRSITSNACLSTKIFI